MPDELKSTAAAREDALAEAIEQWVEDQIAAGQSVPDFWDECDTSEALAEHLVQLGWHPISELDTASKIPSAAQIARFLEAWDILGAYEGSMKQVRGWGAFNDDEWPDKPDPALVAVVEWLKGMCAHAR